MTETKQPHEAKSEINFEDILFILIKWKWVVLFFSLIVPIITMFAMLFVEPVYKSSVIVSTKSSTPESANIGMRLIDAGNALDITDEELFIKSTIVLADVVRELNLNIEFKKKNNIADLIVIWLKNKEITHDYRDNISRVNLLPQAPRGVWIDFSAPNKFLVTNAVGGSNNVIGNGEIGTLFHKGDISFLIENLPHKTQDRFFLVQKDPYAVARELAGVIGVRQLSSRRMDNQTLSMEISVQSSVAVTSVDLANTLASIYLRKKLEEASEVISHVIRFIDEQMNDLTSRTEDSIQAVELYKEKEGLFFVEESAKTKLNSILTLDTSTIQTDLQISILENLLNSIKGGEVITSKQVMLIGSTQTTVAAQIARDINHLQMERRAMERQFTPKHPEMLANEARIDEARKMLVEALESQIEILREQTNTNRIAIERYAGELGEINDGMRNLSRLRRVSEINERLLTYLMRRNEETKISRASIVSNVKIIKPATGAILEKPQKNRYIMSGIFAGILVGLGIAVLLESLDNTVKNPSWVEKELGIPVFGMIPNFEGPSSSGSRKKRPEPKKFRDRTINLIMQVDPKSMVAEAYRSLRTNIQFANLDNPPKVILLTSPAPKEGKSTTIANLAITMANMGSKIVVLDCDLRKPIIHRFFNMEKEIGITDVLSKGLPWRDAVKSTEIENCFIITSGKSPPNPSELLSSKKMKQMLKELREEFDLVLIDSSPIIPVTDAIALAPSVDAVFLIAEVHQTTVLGLGASVTALASVHVRPRGIIFNNLKPEDKRAYGYRYAYGYGYGYKYKYGYNYKYYSNYDYHSYYTTDDDDEKAPPAKGFKAFMEKLFGRKEDDPTNKSDNV